MMTEYISKEVACKDSFTAHTKEYGSIEVVPVDYIASLASSKVKPVIYAKWHYYKNNGIKYVFKCTNCEQKLELTLSELDSNDMPVGYNYCFGCGADMREEKDEKDKYISKKLILSKCEELWNKADETTELGRGAINVIDEITDYIETLSTDIVKDIENSVSYIETLPTIEKPTCKMIPVEFGIDGRTDTFICTNCHQHIHLGFIRQNYSGKYCLECGAEVKGTVIWNEDKR